MRQISQAVLSRLCQAEILLLFLGVLTGACAGKVAAHLLVVRSEKHELSVYTHRLLAYDLNLGREAFQATNAVAEDHFSVCSDQDLAYMRDLVFRSDHIRDIGRVQEGRLSCTSGLGRFQAPPLLSNHPDIVLEGNSIWVSEPLLSVARTRGFIFMGRNVTVVLNPAVFKAMEEPTPRFSVTYIVDPSKNLMVQSFGKSIPLTLKELLASKFIERGGTFYQPECVDAVHACTVTGEPRRDVFLRARRFVIGATVGSSMLGGLLAWIILLLEARRVSSQSQLRKAVRNRALPVVYQPIVDLDTGRIIGAEALARFCKEDGEMLAPDVFIALAEARGFITELTRVIIDRVIAEVGDMMASGSLRVTINITTDDLTDPDFLPMLQLATASRGIQPAFLGLELTERSTADHGLATEVLTRLRRAGFSVSIDDFGTGYSSLAYLHRLSVDAIKIDRSFTQTVGTEAVTASVVPQILAMAGQLDLQVVVEGIETEEQAEYFRKRRPGMQAQGWLYSYPLTALELRKYLQAHQK